ncbi:MAG: hypothetical protein IJK30_11900 [Ruminococcus sp.]|nr:hypothetical protein [Ruminococcus sp.]
MFVDCSFSITLQSNKDAWSFEALVVAEADEIAQMHHDLEDAIRRKAVTKEKIITILKNLYDLMDDADKTTIDNLEQEKWVPREHLIAKTSKIIVNTLVTTLLKATHENLFNLIEENKTDSINSDTPEEEKVRIYSESAKIVLRKSYSEREIISSIGYDVLKKIIPKILRRSGIFNIQSLKLL